MNLAQVLARSFQNYSDRTAVVFGGRKYPYREIDEEIRKRSLWLAKRAGIQQEDRVAILLPKGMEFIFFHLAILSVGAISLPLNPACSEEELSYYLSDGDSSLLITDVAGIEKLGKTPRSAGGVRFVLTDDSSPFGWEPLKNELEKMGPGDGRTYPAQDDDVAVLIYTSGTTGKSKGAMITHRNLVTNMRALQRTWDWNEKDVLLHVLPLFHIHGLIVALHGAFHAGSTVILQEKFEPRETWRTMEKERCTLFTAVPTIYYRLLREWEGQKENLISMRLFISGAAPLSESIFSSFEEKTGFRILDRYGMTETGIIASNPMDHCRRVPKSVGYAVPGVNIRIAGNEGEEVDPGRVGEVWINGDNVFKGYWRMPEKTKEAFEAGWFKTGDLGYQAPEDFGRLYLVGRAKELIISGGYNVFPKEVEEVLERHEGIQEAAVIGVTDEDFGEKVTAVVVLRKDRTPPQPQEIISFCKEHLTSYKCPKQVMVVDHLPRNGMGKVQKEGLQKNCLIYSS